MMKLEAGLLVLMMGTIWFSQRSGSAAPSPAADPVLPDDEAARSKGLQTATFAGGCFWCVESTMEHHVGVVEALSGYAGGDESRPSYQQVARGRTGHVEAVLVRFDPAKVSYQQLLDAYWREIDPTDAGGQFADRGAHYRPIIFAHDAEQRRLAEQGRDALASSGRFDKPITVQIRDAGPFWVAEDDHQDYADQNPAHYQRYRVGSGRAPYLARVWSDPQATPASKAQAAAEGADTQWRERLQQFDRPADEQLRSTLSPLQYKVTQHEGTEQPFQNEFWDHHEPGLYVDLVSGEPLFSSTDKYDSGSGWPSFTRPLAASQLVKKEDRSLFSTRTEVRSRLGNSHLGHVFTDGPEATGLRYCINSAALRFVPLERLAEEGYGEFLPLFDGER